MKAVAATARKIAVIALTVLRHGTRYIADTRAAQAGRDLPGRPGKPARQASLCGAGLVGPDQGAFGRIAVGRMRPFG